MSKVHEYTAKLGDGDITVETGKLAQQAGGAVTVRQGDTMVLVTATADEPREGMDFFPLRVDLEERDYAVGQIPGGFFKREGRPSSQSIVLCRTIDRPLRALFPDNFRNDVQIIVTPLSLDGEHPFDVLSIIGASAALTISDIPFPGPVGAVRVGCVERDLVVNPTEDQMNVSSLDLLVAGTADSVLMIEAGADEVSEELMAEAIALAHREIQGVIAMQERMGEEIGKEKFSGVYAELDAGVMKKVEDLVEEPLAEIVARGLSREERDKEQDALLERMLEQLGEDIDADAAEEAFDKVLKGVMRKHLLETGKRIDGRAVNEIRPLSVEAGLLPRAHGSALFSRGETQVLSAVTLGSASDEQMLDGIPGELSGQESKRYMHHYNFPPYSTGETAPLRSPGRREIGHGALAERAIEPLLPSEEEFPYTIRTVSEVLSSNGSTSMASACASSLALFDAGVPMKDAVAGIAMGLISEGDRYAVLTDIQGLEDFQGDMDFKVTGTKNGITAIQVDIKISGLRQEIIGEALQGAREARLKILDVMNACLPRPREELAPHAPRIETVRIPEEKIGKLIGPGGKTIRSIIEETGVAIDVDDDGTVHVSSSDGAATERALARIEELTAEAEMGRIYNGRVVRVEPYGAFVEFLPGQDGLVHISQLADYRVPSVEDVVQVGDEVMVMVIDIARDGKVKLSRQAVLEGWTVQEARRRDRTLSEEPGERRSSSRGRSRRR
ncbi:MAG: polyribonucleotide nucleotidyltransferase [Chloroflexota bacterium]|nr:polyribonucleotide nucleotidyltransferase [Chloroflexota bacterium]